MNEADPPPPVTAAPAALQWTHSPALPRGFDSAARLYLRPLALLHGAAAAGARAAPLAGSSAFAACQIVIRVDRRATSILTTVDQLRDWRERLDPPGARRLSGLLDRIGGARGPVAGVALDRPALVGIVNVTPDSFSDGGEFLAADAAIAHGRALARAGAAIIDVGGESTRPGAGPVAEGVERSRVLPVIEALAADGLIVSVDSRNAGTMTEAVARGAAMINDVSGLTHQPESLAAAAEAGVPVVLVHSAAAVHSVHSVPAYAHAPLDVYDALDRGIEAAVAAGIPRSRLVIDPGIGFAKTAAQNLEILSWLSLYHGLGCPIMIGVSRKLGRIAGAESAKARLGGSIAGALAGLAHGAQMLRVHDVAQTVQAVAVWRAIVGSDR